MSKVVLALSMALMAGGVCSQAQSFVQISSVRAYPPRLTCLGTGATSKLRAQIYLAGIPEAAKQQKMTVSASVSSAHPSASKIDVRNADQDVALTESPAIVEFPIVCTADTLPGVISIGVTISSVPEGILIKEPAQQALVELKIEPPR